MSLPGAVGWRGRERFISSEVIPQEVPLNLHPASAHQPRGPLLVLYSQPCKGASN